LLFIAIIARQIEESSLESVQPFPAEPTKSWLPFSQKPEHERCVAVFGVLSRAVATAVVAAVEHSAAQTVDRECAVTLRRFGARNFFHRPRPR